MTIRRRARSGFLTLSLVAALAGGSADAATAGNHVLTVKAATSWSARLRWTAPPGTVTVQVVRDGRLIDQFPVGNGTTYTDALLWQSTAYAYSVRFLDGGGGLLLSAKRSVTTPAQVGAFPRSYAQTSFWNTPIPASPAIDPASAAIVATSITPYDPVTNLNNNDTWGIPIAYAAVPSKVYAVGCINYGCTIHVDFKIPRYAAPNHGSDGKLVVIDPATNSELDMGRAAYDAATDTWTTSSRYVAATDGWGAMCDAGQHCDGVLMSGIDQLGGVVRPEEFAQGHIDHALALVVPYWRSTWFACPAVKSGGGTNDPDAIPLGAHVQLDPTFDVDAQTWPGWQKVIAKALQTYGAFVVDAGSGSFEVRAETNLDRGYDAWAKVGIPSGWPPSPNLSNIPWERMRVLQMQQC